MDDKITISTAQLFKMFPDQETARTYLELLAAFGDCCTAKISGQYPYYTIDTSA